MRCLSRPFAPVLLVLSTKLSRIWNYMFSKLLKSFAFGHIIWSCRESVCRRRRNISGNFAFWVHNFFNILEHLICGYTINCTAIYIFDLWAWKNITVTVCFLSMISVSWNTLEIWILENCPRQNESQYANNPLKKTFVYDY